MCPRDKLSEGYSASRIKCPWDKVSGHRLSVHGQFIPRTLYPSLSHLVYMHQDCWDENEKLRVVG